MTTVPDDMLLPGEAELPAEVLAGDYDARASVPPEQYEFELKRYRDLSDAARSELPPAVTSVYDEASGECLDLYGTGAEPRPLVIYIHGGYWRGLSRFESNFMAPALARHGVATAVIDYSLVPKVDMAEIVRQVRASVAYLWQNAQALGLDRSRFVVTGSSAGGHLAGAVVSGGWQAEHGLPEQVFRGALPVSGLFDLSSITRTRVQDWMNLTETDVLAFSPLRNLPTQGCAMVAALAQNDRDGFHRQSVAYRDAWAQRFGRCDYLVVPERQHFDVILDLADDRSALFSALMEFLA